MKLLNVRLKKYTFAGALTCCSLFLRVKSIPSITSIPLWTFKPQSTHVVDKKCMRSITFLLDLALRSHSFENLMSLFLWCTFQIFTGYTSSSDSSFNILLSSLIISIGAFPIVTRIWLTFRHLQKTVEPLARLCVIARNILTAMPRRLKIKLKSHVMLWIYIKLANNLGGEFNGGDLVVARLPSGETTV